VGLIWIIVQNTALSGMEQLSRRSLTIYLVHFIPIGLFHTIDESYAFTLSQSMAVVVVYTLMWLLIANAWGRLAPRRDIEHALAWLVKR
jgi:fucose 4-O-acetylase-like acetyltransferase